MWTTKMIVVRAIKQDTTHFYIGVEQYVECTLPNRLGQLFAIA